MSHGIAPQEQGGRNTDLLGQFGGIALGGLNRWIDAEIDDKFQDRSGLIGNTANPDQPSNVLPNNQANTNNALEKAMSMSRMQMIGAGVVVAALLVVLLK